MADGLFNNLDVRDPAERRREQAEARVAQARDAEERGRQSMALRDAERQLADERAADAVKAQRMLREINQDLAVECTAIAEQSRTNRRRHLIDAVGASGNELGQARMKAISAHTRAQQFDAIAAELRTTTVKVTEPSVYGPHSDASYFADLALYVSGVDSAPGYGEARKRLERHSRGLGWDATEPGKRGDYARRALRERARGENPDEAERLYRSMTTGASSGGALVPPAYLVEDYAVYREYVPSYAEQAVTTRPLPDYGMTVKVPKFTGPAGAAEQTTEGNPLTETDPTGAYVDAPVRTFAGVVTASQQLADRGGPLGFDQAIFAQLQQDLAQQVDVALITVALAGATTYTRATFGIPGLLADFGQMASGLETAAGVKLSPTCAVTTPVLGEWLMSQVGSDNRPVFMPAPGAGSRADGFLGYSPSGIPLWTDGSLPLSSGHAQIVVTSKAAVWHYAGTPTMTVIPNGAGASSLQAVFRLHQYSAFSVRYAAGVAAASGAAYPAAPTWA